MVDYSSGDAGTDEPAAGTGGGIASASGGGSQPGGATINDPAYDTVLSTTVRMPVAGIIDVDGYAMQQFSAPTGAWSFQLWVDGSLLWSPGGIAIADTVALGGVKYCEAGDRVILLRWSGATSVTLLARFLKVRGFNNVSG